MIALDADPLRCFDRETSDAMVAEVDAAHKEGETLGGVVEVLAYGLPPGLGSYVHWDRRLDSRLAAALMGIQAIKGVEVGDGFLTAARRGSAAHDEIVKDADGRIIRTSNRAGGIEGGMSIGDVLRVRAAMKPIATVPRALRPSTSARGRPPRPTTSAPTSVPSRPPASWPRPWWPWCSPKRSRKNSAVTPCRRPRATSRVTWTTFRRPWTRSATSAGREHRRALRRGDARGNDVGPVVLIGPMAVGKSAIGQQLAAASGRALRGHRRLVVVASTGPIAEIFAEPRRARLPRDRGPGRGPGHRRGAGRHHRHFARRRGRP